MIKVLVVGAGPVGLTMAAELARHGVRSRIIEQNSQPSPYCRAIGVTPRTLEVWDDMGIAREMVDAGLWLEGTRFVVHGRGTYEERFDFYDLPYWELGIPQYETERVLARHLGRLGIVVERGVRLAEMRQEHAEVVATLDHYDGRREQASFAYIIGCDGAHSTVRDGAGIGFEGDAFPLEFMLGDVKVGWDMPRGLMFRASRLVENSAPEMFIAIPLPESNRYRVSTLLAPELRRSPDPSHGIQSERPAPRLHDFQAIADALVPGKPRLSDMRWSSIFGIGIRLAARYREGRVFIAGDAAHIHPPVGGQGMNTGIQDAYNLAWKLALVLDGVSPTSLLDSYESERRPVAAEVIARTRAASERMGRPGGESHRLADSQILVSYKGGDWVRDEGAASEVQAGDRAPDCIGLRQYHIGFPLRLFDVLRGTEHVLLIPLGLSATGDEAARLEQFVATLRDRLGSRLRFAAIAPASVESPQISGVQVVRDAEGQFSRAYGQVTYLVRPDGYIGWRGESWRDVGLIAHLRRLFLDLGSFES